MIPTAVQVIAKAPLGHTVMIQKSSAAPMTTKARPALTREREPIGHAKPDATASRHRSSRIGDEQSQPVQRARNGGQHLGRLLCEQPQGRRSCRQRDQPPHRRPADPAQTDGIGDPTRRFALLRRRSPFLGYVLQNSVRFPPRPVGGQAPQMHGHRVCDRRGRGAFLHPSRARREHAVRNTSIVFSAIGSWRAVEPLCGDLLPAVRY